MNATERLGSAIEKLESLKVASQGERWYRSIGGISAYGGKFGASPEGIVHVRDGERSAYTPQMTSADADLIVTLHDTIDAQLLILRLGVPVDGEEFTEAGGAYKAVGVLLADAILGGA